MPIEAKGSSERLCLGWLSKDGPADDRQNNKLFSINLESVQEMDQTITPISHTTECTRPSTNEETSNFESENRRLMVCVLSPPLDESIVDTTMLNSSGSKNHEFKEVDKVVVSVGTGKSAVQAMHKCKNSS